MRVGAHPELIGATYVDTWQVRVNGVGTTEGRVLALIQGRPRTVGALVVLLGVEWIDVVRVVLRLWAEGEIYSRASLGGDAVWERCS